MFHFFINESFILLFDVVGPNKEWGSVWLCESLFSILGHVPISSLKLNASLYLYSMSNTFSFLSPLGMADLNLCIFLVFFHLSYIFSHHWGLTMDNFPLILPVPSFFRVFIKCLPFQICSIYLHFVVIYPVQFCNSLKILDLISSTSPLA